MPDISVIEVLVPGPQGPIGISVPDGGLANQFLKKTSNVSYAYGWSYLGLSDIRGITAARLLGRTTAGEGVAEELTVGSGLTLDAGQLKADVYSVNGRTGDVVLTSGDLSDATAVNTPDTVVKRDGSGNFAAGTITASLAGNASTSGRWLNARTITLTGDASGSTSIDGSGNVSLATTVAFPVTSVNGKSGNVTLVLSDIATASSSNTANALVQRDSSGNFAAGTITADLTGTASVATVLETPRTIELDGDVTGSVEFDGSGDVILTASLARSVEFSGTTTDATPTEIFVGGVASSRMVIPANTTRLVTINVVARSAAGADSAAFVYCAAISRDGSNNTTLIEAVYVTGLGTLANISATPHWEVNLTADDTNESLKIAVTGQAATTIKWSARADYVDVLHA